MANEITKRGEAFLKILNREVDIAQERVSKAFQGLCQFQTIEWAKQFPNHRFEISEWNGSLSLNIYPPFGEFNERDPLKNHIDYMQHSTFTKEQNELVEEWNYINSVYCNEIKVSPGFCDVIQVAYGK